MSVEPNAGSAPANISFVSASVSTSLALQRTRMAADRTLMAIIRTALSLISFGFTIYNIIDKLQSQNILKISDAVPHFAVALVLLGIIMLVVGIIYHAQFMLQLRHERAQLIAQNVVPVGKSFPISFTMITAVLLFLLGVVAIVSMVFRIGPLE
jgi:putative membrane protein